MAIEVQIPGMGESVSEAILLEWLKAEGEYTARDEPLCVLETDKANVDLPAPAAGVVRHLKAVGDALAVGDVIARIEEGTALPVPVPTAPATAAPPVPAAVAPAAASPAPPTAGDLSPAVRRLVAEHGLDPAAIPATGKGGRLTREDVLAYLEPRPAAAPAAPPATTPAEVPVPPPPVTEAAAVPVSPPVVPAPASGPASSPPTSIPKPSPASAADGVRRVPMPRIRQRIAEHLVAAQHTAAMLTTFNEVDMSGVTALRAKYKDRFSEVHGVGLGLISFFARAVTLALAEYPAVNAFIDGSEIVYHDYVNLGIAVSTERGLVVPVLQRAEQMSMARIEAEIKRLAQGARDNKLSMDDLGGGTFTITNGGVFGSLLSTPILNAPQSGILGMHAIQQRPVAVEGRIEIRPMMYVALSYDHRLVDGQQSVSFLVRVKQLVEDPARLLLQV